LNSRTQRENAITEFEKRTKKRLQQTSNRKSVAAREEIIDRMPVSQGK
jgi:hypothetical protein